ncbi:MAG TPA: class I SAM-dependent rRNA methyltransferase [Bryobacteraceae bacterium]|nr:class I SAM-dependent rRNA methyltransferase [Bryobacteraceae bacterium]
MAATVRVNRKASDRIASGHPWIFVSDVLDRGDAEPGAVVTVVDPKGRALGTAHYSSTSQICLRLLSDRVESVNREFFLRRLDQAESYRRRVLSDTTAYRLVHGEADRLPGLVIDRYADCFVVQTLDQGMDRAKADIVSCLEERYAPSGIVERNDVAVRSRESLPLESGLLAGEIPEAVPIKMNGLELTADLLHGQKTGVFLDQRENYLAAAQYARGRALDCFTSTGGFALHMAAHCESVEAVDSSATALATAAANATRNSIANINWREADVFDLLAGYVSARRSFDTIVLDPPAFAKSRSNIDAAARGYKEINLRGLRLLAPGGTLITCSCSHHMSEAMLLTVLAEASLDAHCTLRIVERRTQARDHPILLTVPETHYLKCLIAQVVPN